MPTHSPLPFPALAARPPAAPVLTAYDADGARTELSGASLANAVAKNANLLTDGVGGPDRVALALPMSWQAVVLALAILACGATVVLDGPAEVAFASAGRRADAAEVFAVSLHPLGLPLTQVPAGQSDHAREVAAHGDLFLAAHPPGDLQDAEGRHALQPAPQLTPSDRVLIVGTGLGLLRTVVLPALAAGASVVLVPPGGERWAAAENITATLPG